MYYDIELERRVVSKQISQAESVWMPFVIPEQIEAWHEGHIETEEATEESRIAEFSCH